MSQKKSAIWLHFEEVNNNKAKCNLCHSLYSYHGGTTSNLRKHIRTKHPTIRIVEPVSVTETIAVQVSRSSTQGIFSHF